MKASELRIGNWFKWSVHASMGIDEETITEDNHYNHNQLREPVPLTEEWLINLGFENISKSQIVKLNGNAFILRIHERIYLEVDGDDNFAQLVRIPENRKRSEKVIIPQKCAHVHQLQNLYFALTGEELKIKE